MSRIDVFENGFTVSYFGYQISLEMRAKKRVSGSRSSLVFFGGVISVSIWLKILVWQISKRLFSQISEYLLNPKAVRLWSVSGQIGLIYEEEVGLLNVYASFDEMLILKKNLSTGTSKMKLQIWDTKIVSKFGGFLLLNLTAEPTNASLFHGK